MIQKNIGSTAAEHYNLKRAIKDITKGCRSKSPILYAIMSWIPGTNANKIEKLSQEVLSVSRKRYGLCEEVYENRRLMKSHAIKNKSNPQMPFKLNPDIWFLKIGLKNVLQDEISSISIYFSKNDLTAMPTLDENVFPSSEKLEIRFDLYHNRMFQDYGMQDHDTLYVVMQEKYGVWGSLTPDQEHFISHAKEYMKTLASNDI